ncbi:uncharacterized protein isoform X2 [Rhodnius prolixus]|uniref:uncharacterized protein isoform X2 n=1 Tax=Rhodnius prolixus TaxID=13249 RepID=UPI003D18B9A2
MQLISSVHKETISSSSKWSSRSIRSGQQEIRRRPLAGTAVGGNRMPSSRREPTLFGKLKKETVSSCVRTNNSNPSTGLDLDKLHVLKIKCRDPSPSMNTTHSNNNLHNQSHHPIITKDIKFSKYSPLPAIKSRPSLLREKTYDVLEPVFVKGPLQDAKVAEPPVEVRIKLPEIRSNRLKTSRVKKHPVQEILSASTSPPSKKDIPKYQPSAASPLTTTSATATVRLKTAKKRQPFNPNLISKASMPESPTVFWFPV